MYGQDYATAGFARAGELGRVAKEWATAETGATVLGVAGGVFLGEWLGSWMISQFNVTEGWTKVLTKGITKAALSFAFFFIARKVTPGIGRVFLTGMAAGPLVSVIGDVIGEFVAPALGLVPGNVGNLTIKPKTTNIPTNVGNRNSVITTV